MQATSLFELESSSFDPFMKLLHEGVKASLGENVFFAWFKELSFKSYDGHTLLLSVGNDKIKNCIFLHYQNRFERILQKTFTQHFKKRLQNFDLIVENRTREEVEVTWQNEQPLREKSKFNIGISLEKKYIFNNLLVSEENKLAVGIAKHFANSIIQKGEDILHFSRQFFICGGIGNGKTHLAQAIANEVLANSKEKIMYTTAERFLFNFQTAVKTNETVEFMKDFMGLKLLIIDDIHFICTKKKTMEEMQRVAYSVMSDGGFIIFCSSGLPLSLPIENPKVKSFLSSSYVIKIESPSEEFRFQLLKFKVANSNYKVSDGTLKTLASKIHTNIRELEGAMARIVLHSQILNYEIDAESTRFITTDIFPHKELKKFSIAEVQEKVCTHFGISLEEIQSKKRVRHVLKARQIAMFISAKLTTCSYIEIGKYFKRTHSTVIHSLKIVEKEFIKSRSFKEEVDALRIKIEDGF